MELIAKVLDGIDAVLGPSKKRTVTVTENCPNERCAGGTVLVDAGMHWQPQICPTCFGARHVKVRREIGADVALTGSHDYAK